MVNDLEKQLLNQSTEIAGVAKHTVISHKYPLKAEKSKLTSKL